jgi:murein DD-endopeptidase MepM/ murein hydrolase activator NlpD
MQLVENTPDLGCLVRVLHNDGSMALYAHLQAGSLQVRLGQSVETGQALAASGNTGQSTGPHLHFAIQANTGLALTSLRFRMRSERGELKFSREVP